MTSPNALPNPTGKFVVQAARRKNIDLDKANVEQRFQIFQEALKDMETAISETRRDHRWSDAFKRFVEMDLRPDLKYIIEEIVKIYRSRTEASINSQSLEKIENHIDNAIDKINLAMHMCGESKIERCQNYCRRCEKSLYEAQLLLETPLETP